ncbi:polysaccharide biosynthesis tyrosine autokinase [Flavobacteriaceae bacterium MHTCC 0001]
MEKDIFKIILGYLKYWYLFLIGAIICLVLAFLHIRYNIVPEYYASCKVLLNDKEEGDSQGLQSIGNLGLIKNTRNIDDQIGVLQSFDIMEQTIDELGFNVGYYVEGRFTEIEVYEKSLPFKVVLNDSVPLLGYGSIGRVSIADEFSYNIENTNEDGSLNRTTHNFGDKVSSDFGEFHIELNSTEGNYQTEQPVMVRFRDVNALAAAYNNKLNIVNLNEGALLELSLTDAIPERGIDVINKLIEVYAQNSADDKNFLAQATLKLIDERLELLSEDLNVAEKDVETYKQRNDLINVEADASRFVNMADEVTAKLNALRGKISTINSLESSLSQSSSSSFSPISSYNIDSPSLIGSIIAYNTEVQKRKNIISASGTGNPMLREMESQMLESKSMIVQNVKNIKNQLLREQSNLRGELGKYRGKISSVPTAERALLEINRDQGIKQKLYLFLLQKREEEALSISVPFSDTRIIETAKATGYPVNGAKTPVYLGALLLGLFVPFAFLFAKDMLNTKVLSKEDIQSVTDVSVLGIVANSKSKKRLVVSRNNTSPVVELFRLMRHNLKFLLQGKKNQVIMVTSGRQGEGKTFVSINLAASLAITDKKVIVLGFDLRVPKLTKDMQLSSEYGLSDYIIDPEIDVDDIIVPYENEKNLCFIGSGAIPPNPGELMLNARVEELISRLREIYDYIIIDTAPIGKVADAYSLASFIDSTLFVVKYNYTKKEELKIINEVSEDKRLNPLMIILNDVKLNKSGAYSYGYGAKE